MKRLASNLTVEIKASPEYIIRMACPKEELKWIPGWEYDMLYSESGVNEANCIFSEEMSGPHFFGSPMKTIWVTANHDPDAGRILFQLQIGCKASIRFEFNCREIEASVSECTWQMTFTALDETADALPDHIIEEKLDLLMVFLSDTLKHYCETGKMLA